MFAANNALVEYMVKTLGRKGYIIVLVCGILLVLALLFGCQTAQIAEPQTDEITTSYDEVEGHFFRAIIVCNSEEGITTVAAGLTQDGPWDEESKSYFETGHCVKGRGFTVGKVFHVLGTVQIYDGTEGWVVEWESRVTHEGAGIYGIVWPNIRVNNPASLDKWEKPYEEPGQPV